MLHPAANPILHLFLVSVFTLSPLLFLSVADAGDPCCNIVSIDKRTGLVTARNLQTGQTFQFTAKNAALLNTLRIGQKVAADFASGQVSVDRSEPCCNIVRQLPNPGR
jgi:hypothetical protein